jgi:LAO/AO transport system kinase
VARAVEVPELVQQARAGRPRAVGRLVSLVEDGHPALREVMAGLAPYTGQAQVVGVTGAPGVGKSTIVAGLVRALRGQGLRVGVLCVDPSSPVTGGALLGDRVHLQAHALDPGVFVRSMATRGQLGGLAWSTPQALRILDAAAFDVILVETAGVGRAEVEVASLADTTVVVVAGEVADGVQAAAAGVLEVGDVYVVNRADTPGAEEALRELRAMLRAGGRPGPGAWRPPVIRAVAVQGEGVDRIARALRDHELWSGESGQLAERRARRAAREIEVIVSRIRRARSGVVADHPLLAGFAEEVVAGRMDPYLAARRLMEAMRREDPEG